MAKATKKRNSTRYKEKLADILFDFEKFCANFLKIKTKAGRLVPFELNPLQVRLHNEIEEQRRQTGRVRVIILKGRQIGISTYTQARFLWRMFTGGSLRAFILTHHSEATKNIFRMTKRYLENIDQFTVNLGTSNINELTLPNLGSSYRVGTAGSSATGRSDTIQLLHGSEVAFWPNSEEHMAGLLQAIPNQDGTEIILESTANGLDKTFYRIYTEEGSDSNDDVCAFKPIFLPWFLQEEYSIHNFGNLSLDAEEIALKARYDLTDHQMFWRRLKIRELGSVAKFEQEYPNAPSDAFKASFDETLIDPAVVIEAQKHSAIEPFLDHNAPMAIGVDPSGPGKDKTAIAIRQGRAIFYAEAFSYTDESLNISKVIELIKKYNPDRVFIDNGGVGSPQITSLTQMGYGDVISRVNFGSPSTEKNRFANKRSEMYCKFREWLKDDVFITKNDAIPIQAGTTLFKPNMLGGIQLLSKEHLKSKGMSSPDLLDAIILTFAEDLPNRDAKKFLNSYENGGSVKNHTWDPFAI